MKQSLQSKQKLALRLSGYAASAGALLALNPFVQGQVVYSGIQNIQLSMPSDYAEIDMDGDMISDFGFIIGGYSGYSTFTYLYRTYYAWYGYGWAEMFNARTDGYLNSWITRMTTITSYSGPYSSIPNYYYYPILNGLGAGVTVDSLQTMWNNLTYAYYPGAFGIGYLYSITGPYFSYYFAIGYGDFFGDERYVGVRFYIGSEQHYGWLRVSLGEYIDPMTIIDWAYESTPGVGITTGVPTIEFSGVDELVSEATQTLSITFSEEVTGFEIGDIVVTNGTPANLVEVTAGLEYMVEITADTDGEVSVEIGNSAVTDLDGIGNPAAETSWMYDGTPPTVTLDPGVTGTTHEQIVTVSVEFSEEISGLGLTDFIITNGTASNLAVVAPRTEFSVDITAAADGDVTVTLPAGAVTDDAGNDNTEASATYTYEEPVNNLNNLSEEGIKIYPNPVDDNLHIELETESMLHIVNLNGTILYQQDHVLNNIIDMSGFSPGVYIMQIKNDSGVTQHKLIVE